MKHLTIILLLLLALACAGQAQDIISETESIISRADTVICEGDTISPIYFLVRMKVTDNGTANPDTTTSAELIKSGLYCPADSAEVVDQIFNSMVNTQLQIDYHIGMSFQRATYRRSTNSSEALLQTVTGENPKATKTRKLFPSFEGKYRIITGTENILCDFVLMGNGRARLVNQADPNQFWVFTPDSPTGFVLSQFDLGAGPQNWVFKQDRRQGAEHIYWPIERLTGSSGAFRVVKIR